MDVRRLDAAVAAFPTRACVAVEYRHPSWCAPAVESVLARRGAALCLADRLAWGGGRGGQPPGATCAFTPGRAPPAGCYTPRALLAWAARVAALWPASAEVFAFFNNDGWACALRDAIVFAPALHDLGRATTRVPAPAEVAVG
jgi:uncharacterized protein YecE (DUF72 family)